MTTPSSVYQPAAPVHQHVYVFLRQETIVLRVMNDRVRERAIEDWYYCEGCLLYKKVRIRVEESDSSRYGWREIRG